ncbi:MAG: hypothetical protein ACOC2H_05760 [Spirochaetota bacterium]
MKHSYIFIFAGFAVSVLFYTVLLFWTAEKLYNDPHGYSFTSGLETETEHHDLLVLHGNRHIQYADTTVVLRQGFILDGSSVLELTGCTLYIDTHYENLAVCELYGHSSLILMDCTVKTANGSPITVKLLDSSAMTADAVDSCPLSVELYGTNSLSLLQSRTSLIIGERARPEVYIKGSHIPFITRTLPGGSYRIHPPERAYVRHYSSTLGGHTVILDSTVQQYEYLLLEGAVCSFSGPARMSLILTVSSGTHTHRLEGLNGDTLYPDKRITIGTVSATLTDIFLSDVSIMAEKSVHCVLSDSSLTSLNLQDDAFVEMENSFLSNAQLYDRSALALYGSETDARIHIHDESLLFLENSSIDSYNFYNRSGSFYIYDDGRKK